MPDDRELLLRWRAGESRAGEALYNRHNDVVLRFFRRLVYDTGEVQSLVHDTFMTCKTAKSEFRGAPENVRGYILGVARNKLHEYVRGKLRRDRLVDPHAAVDGDAVSMDSLGGDDPAAFVEESEERKLLLKAMRKLPVDTQILLILVFWEGATGPMIAEIFGVPLGTAASRLRLARDAVRKQLHTFAANPELVETTRVTFERWWDEVKARAASLLASDEPGAPED